MKNQHLQEDTSFSGVMSYQNAEVVEKLKIKLNLSPTEAGELFEDTKRYLYLCSVTGKALAPPFVIDKGWHEFLMYTKDYQEFCLNILGKFVHHTPNPTLRPHTVLRVSDTNKIALEYFGSLSDNWRVYSQDCSPDYDCNGDTECQ